MKKEIDNQSMELDRELVSGAMSGDQKAFNTLMSKYRDHIFTYIQQFIKSGADSEDLTQECFNKAFINLKSYNSQFAFSTWLYNIAKNCCIDYYRKSRLNEVPLGDGESYSGREISSNTVPSPEESIISGQTIDEMIVRIDSLEKIYKEVAILRFLKEYAYEEISAELNLPLNTVRTRVKRAKVLLLKRWKNQ